MPVVQTPDSHVVVEEQAMETLPAMPQNMSESPTSHVTPAQHPVHDVSLQMHASLTHVSPLGQLPWPQRPPHPSAAPHSWPLQFGVHVQMPPSQVSGDEHVSPAQHSSSA